MDAAQHQNLSIGITYAVRHLKSIFIALKWAYGKSWGPQAGGHDHEARRQKVEDALKSQNIYTMLAADTKISGAALGYIYRTDNLIEKLVTPAKDGGGDWKPTRNLISKFFDDMERDLQQVAPPSSNQVTSGFTDWKWDAGREQWYYWCSVDRTFKYENGMWLRLDGSSTSFAEEIELAKAQGIPVRSGPSNINSVAASMQLLTIGRGEDVD